MTYFGSYLDPFWVYFGPILTLFWTHPRTPQRALRLKSGGLGVSILDLFWVTFGPIWTPFDPVLDLPEDPPKGSQAQIG